MTKPPETPNEPISPLLEDVHEEEPEGEQKSTRDKYGRRLDEHGIPYLE